jgi:hypothetical protein
MGTQEKFARTEMARALKAKTFRRLRLRPLGIFVPEIYQEALKSLAERPVLGHIQSCRRLEH